MDTWLEEVDLNNTRVRKGLMEFLPAAARLKCSSSDAVPAEVIKQAANGGCIKTVGDLILELAVMLTDGSFCERVEIDASAVGLVPVALDREVSEDPHWARLVFDLSRPDWTVIVSLQALENAPCLDPGKQGVLRILVCADLDFRGWLAEERTQTMLHEWYVQYQVAGTLHPERQLAELHEELGRLE